MTPLNQKHKHRLSTLLKAAVIAAGCSLIIQAASACSPSTSAFSGDDNNAVETEQETREWAFSTFGAYVNSTSNGCEGSFDSDDGAVTIYSENNRGKIVPGSTDGLAFYYTSIDPESENFTLTATVTVDSWTYSNGQEGFGMMVADAVGENGDKAAFWNNDYQLLVSKIEYYYDTTADQVTTDPAADMICMKLGIGTLSNPVTVTAADVEKLQSGTISAPEGWGDGRIYTPLDTTCGPLGAGTYNIVGNCTNPDALVGSQSDLITSFIMQITRDNTGYSLTYLDENGEEIAGRLFYDSERDALTQIDPDHIYVGFFAARNARITVTDMEFTTTDPTEDAAAEERQPDYLTPSSAFISAEYSNTPEYELVYYGNADGTLTITDSAGTEILNTHTDANEKAALDVSLAPGANTFTGSFTPDPDYMPSSYTRLTSYDTREFEITVNYEAYDSKYLYIGPEGSADASGTREDPMDIYTAVRIINPGQTIIILDGTYHLADTVIVERGIDGTEDSPIYMIADPESGERPVFDFGDSCAGMVLAGNYWYFSGFAVTNSENGKEGILLSGSYNTVDNVWTYRNGNTGLQISRYKDSDERDLWPCRNLILNCTSFLNADGGYEDADGFAAKITAGDDNIFDGCIAAYNADDGWDLYTKVQYGQIGAVTIQNSVAFKNGYDIRNGEEVAAGNGSGFKMGGEDVSGAHRLIHCVSFSNRGKGIDANGSPNIQVYSSTAFDNESFNLALSSDTAANTAYVADGMLSYRSTPGESDEIVPLGTQDLNDLDGESNYYYNYYDTQDTSRNQSGEVAADNWFINMDTDAAIHGGISRDDNNRIDMGGYLVLTPTAPDGVGAEITGTPSEKFIRIA